MSDIPSRRAFLKQSGLLTAAIAATSSWPLWAQTSTEASASTSSITLDACQTLTPAQMAGGSPLVQASWRYLQQQVGAIRQPAIRRLIETIYANPAPLTVQRLNNTNRRQLWRALVDRGYTKSDEASFLPPLPGNQLVFANAPGSGYQSHHAYPGGLATHVAANVHITQAIVDAYQQVYSYDVERDIAVAAQLLHDLHKPYVFQWLPDHSSRAEQTLAGTGEHHILSLAELIYRKAPPQLITATACAHQPPTTDQDCKQIATWLDAAAMIAGTDAAADGLIVRKDNSITLPPNAPQEGYICHLGDHDYVLSVPAVKLTLPILQSIAAADYRLSASDLQGKPFNALRNRLYAHHSAMRVHKVMLTEGENGVRQLMHSLVRPV